MSDVVLNTQPTVSVSNFREPMVSLESRESREKPDRRVTLVHQDPKDLLVPPDLRWVSLLTF